MKKAPARRLSVSQLSKQVRDAARDPAYVFFTSHAEQEMQADRLTALEVRQALRSCVVTEVQPGERLKIEGRTATGEMIACVAQLFELKRTRSGLRS